MLKTAEEAEQAFYTAFAQQDVEGMMHVWAPDRPVFCIHPGGGLLSRQEDIEESWRQIFQAEMPFHFELESHYWEEFGNQSAVSQLTETLYLQNRVVGIVQVTNMYCATEQGWRMILHHASPQPDLEQPEPGEHVLH